MTFISGTFNLGMGEKFDKSAGRTLAAGSFAFMPPGMRHYAWATGETVSQVHGTGPWRINYVNPADDPRKQEVVRRRGSESPMGSGGRTLPSVRITSGANHNVRQLIEIGARIR